MSDLIERLRLAAPHMTHKDDCTVLNAAADEIERLRAELAEAVTALPQAVRNERERCLGVITQLRTAALIDDWHTFDALIREARRGA